jgi:hypothetical protein
MIKLPNFQKKRLRVTLRFWEFTKYLSSEIKISSVRAQMPGKSDRAGGSTPWSFFSGKHRKD